jgi:hypothetical protein
VIGPPGRVLVLASHTDDREFRCGGTMARRSEAGAEVRHTFQRLRRYANPEYIWNLARTHAINVSREYAEVFQVYRVIA